jgi:CRISPR/Cas system-associated endonuclease Cas3-HD
MIYRPLKQAKQNLEGYEIDQYAKLWDYIATSYYLLTVLFVSMLLKYLIYSLFLSIMLLAVLV